MRILLDVVFIRVMSLLLPSNRLCVLSRSGKGVFFIPNSDSRIVMFGEGDSRNMCLIIPDVVNPRILYRV